MKQKVNLSNTDRVVRFILGGAALGFGAWYLTPAMHPVLRAVVVLGPYGVTYLGTTLALGLPEATSLVRRLRR